MRILIATPLYPPDIGGPATYAHGLKKAMEAEKIDVELLVFKKFLKYPSGLRHFLFFLEVLKKIKQVDSVIILDTVSVAIPAIIAARVFQKPTTIRIGGDFVWEHYIERTGEKIKLSQFYTSNRSLSIKEKILIWIQRAIIFPMAREIVFSTEWLKEIWSVPYQLENKKIRIIENAYASDISNGTLGEKVSEHTVVWIGRSIALKNVAVLNTAIARAQEKIPSITYEKYSGIDRAQVLNVLRRTRVLVIPSISEVSPNLALEAIALGVPVLLTEDCGLKDVLKDSVVWIDSNDVERVANDIIALMDEDQYAKARERALSFTSNRSYTEVAHEFLIERSSKY